MSEYRRKIIEFKPFIYITVFTFLKPSGIDAYGYKKINLIINILQLICVFVIFLYSEKRIKKVSKVLLSEFLFFSLWLFCFLVNESGVSQILKFLIFGIGIELLVEYFVKHGQLSLLAEVFLNLYIVLLLVNICFMLLNYEWKLGIYNGLYDKFSYIESDNGTTGYIMGAFLCALLCTRFSMKKMNIKCMAVLILAILNELRIWSATAWIGILMVGIYILWIRYSKLVKMKYLFWGSVIMYSGVTFFKLQKLFSLIIVNILHRDINMTGRTSLWMKGLQLWELSPVWGMGDRYTFPLDNVIIQNLTQGGLLLTSAFFLYFFFCAKNIMTKKVQGNPIVRDSSFIFCSIIILCIAESWVNFKNFYIIMAFCANSYRCQYFVECQNYAARFKRRFR